MCKGITKGCVISIWQFTYGTIYDKTRPVKLNVLQDFDPCKFIYLASNLNCYIFRKIYDVGFLFSACHTGTFLYVTIYFGVLLKHGADVMTSHTQWGLKQLYLQVGVFKSLPIWCIPRGILSLLICSVC